MEDLGYFWEELYRYWFRENIHIFIIVIFFKDGFFHKLQCDILSASAIALVVGGFSGSQYLR